MERKNYVIKYSGPSEQMSLEEFYEAFTNSLLDYIVDDIRNKDFVVGHYMHIHTNVTDICDAHIMRAYNILKPSGFMDEEKWDVLRDKVRLLAEDICVSLEQEFMYSLINDMKI